MCVGSLLGIALAGPISFSVGKVKLLTLYQMNFSEFLGVNEKELLVSHLQTLHVVDTVPGSVLPKLWMLYCDYLITGGTPEAASVWVQTHDVSRVEEIQRQILQTYALDFVKHAPLRDVPKLTLIWEAIPQQLAKDAEKFVFSHVKTGAWARDLVYMVANVDRPGVFLSCR